jgi:hypothetical protein
MDYWVSEELKPDVLRAPEIDDRIREIYNSERAAEKAREPVPQATVPTPTTDAGSIISTTPGVDPPAANTVFNIPVGSPAQPPLLPSLSFTLFGKKKKKAVKSIFDNIKLLYPVSSGTASAPIPPTPSSSLPCYTAPVKAPSDPSVGWSGGGGGCVVLESFIPVVDGQVFNGSLVDRAYQLQEGFDIVLGDLPESIQKQGKVKRTAIEVQPCVRVSTVDGISLICSTTAPLATLRGTVHAPDVLGESVAVLLEDGQCYWQRVASVEPVGDRFVMVIDAFDNWFWAGEKKGAYILHHNAKIGTQVNKV